MIGLLFLWAIPALAIAMSFVLLAWGLASLGAFLATAMWLIAKLANRIFRVAWGAWTRLVDRRISRAI